MLNNNTVETVSKSNRKMVVVGAKLISVTNTHMTDHFNACNRHVSKTQSVMVLKRLCLCKKSLKIPKGQSEFVYRRTDNTMAKRKSTGQTTIHKT